MTFSPAERTRRGIPRPHSTQSRHHVHVPPELLPQPLRPRSPDKNRGGGSRVARSLSAPGPAFTGLDMGFVGRLKRSVKRGPRAASARARASPPAEELAELDTTAASVPRSRVAFLAKSIGTEPSQEEPLLTWPVAVPGRESMGLVEVSCRRDVYDERLTVRVRHRDALLLEERLGVDEVLAVAGEDARSHLYAGHEADAMRHLLSQL